MKDIIKKNLASILTVLMVFSLVGPAVYADTAEPLASKGTISISLEIKGDAQMGTLYSQELEVEEGLSAFDLLKRVVDEKQIQLAYDEEWKFVTGINGLNQMDKGPNSGWLYKVNHASPDVGAGDMILKQNDHVLFFYTLDYTLENDDEVENVVVVDYADRSDVSAWAASSVDKAIALGLIVGDDQNMVHPKKSITRPEFMSLLALTDEATSQVKSFISREEMALILASSYDLKGAIPKVIDANEISQDAKESVGAVLEKGFMSGVGNDLFAPQAEVTREMAISVAIRIIENN